MNVNTGEIKTSEEIKRLFANVPPPKQWTKFGTGDVVSLHNLAGKRVGWFRISLVAKKRVSLKPISEQEAEEEAKQEGLA